MSTINNNLNMRLEDLSLQGERIMLVGGAGFIGHHLAIKLKSLGSEVLIVDNMQVNNIVNVMTNTNIDDFKRKLYLDFILNRFEILREKNIQIDTLDARNLNELANSFSNFQPTKTVHLAAISSAVEANKYPNFSYDIQINSLRNLLSLCQIKNSSCNHLCFMSSSTVYGDFDKDSVDETVRPKPKGVYANGKYIGERMVREAKDLHGINYTIIRPSALYGIRCVSGRVSQKFIENALMKKPLVLEGGGSGMLDFTYIDDLVEGITRSLCLEGGINRTFNITYGNARPVSHLVDIILKLIPNTKVEEGPSSKEKPKRGTLEVKRSQKYLGFFPSYAIDTAYKDYCQWYINKWEMAKKYV